MRCLFSRHPSIIIKCVFFLQVDICGNIISSQNHQPSNCEKQWNARLLPFLHFSKHISEVKPALCIETWWNKNRIKKKNTVYHTIPFYNIMSNYWAAILRKNPKIVYVTGHSGLQLCKTSVKLYTQLETMKSILALLTGFCVWHYLWRSIHI